MTLAPHAKTQQAKNQNTDYQVPVLDTSDLDYAGDVTPSDCWAALDAVSNAVLVDVRTQAEWMFVGVPNLQSLGKEVQLIEWQTFPSMKLNETFTQTLETVATDKAAPVFFICRSGARSVSAARTAQAAGYQQAYNIAGGVEGDVDANGHRGQLNGWKKEQLTWQQA